MPQKDPIDEITCPVQLRGIAKGYRAKAEELERGLNMMTEANVKLRDAIAACQKVTPAEMEPRT